MAEAFVELRSDWLWRVVIASESFNELNRGGRHAFFWPDAFRNDHLSQHIILRFNARSSAICICGNFQTGRDRFANTTIDNEATENVPVLLIGSLASGVLVMAGYGGPVLVVDSVNTTDKTVALINDTGYDVTILNGTRLISLDSPDVYSDSGGLNEIDYRVASDANGLVRCFVAAPVFDYVLPGTTWVVYDNKSHGTSAGSPLSWNHSASGTSRYVVVAVAWSPTGSVLDPITSATYDGVEMRLVAKLARTALYIFKDPPTGSKQISFTFQSSSVTSAVGGAVSATGVDPVGPIGPVVMESDISNFASVVISNSTPTGLVVDALALVNVSGTAPTITPDSLQTERWNETTGTSPKISIGGGSTKPCSSEASVEMSWDISTGTKLWYLFGVEFRSPARLFKDYSSNWLDASDFSSIQEAIDALPPNGGTVNIGPGVFTSTSIPSFAGLVLPPDRPVRLLGAGSEATTLLLDNEDVHMITISADNQTVEGLTLLGRDVGGDGYGIRIWRAADGPVYPDKNFILQENNQLLFRINVNDVVIKKCPNWGIYFDVTARHSPHGDELTVFAMIRNVNIDFNKSGGGIYVAPSVDGIGPSTTIHFLECRIAHFLGYGIYINQASGVSINRCIIDGSLNGAQPYVLLEGCSNVVVAQCWFEGVVFPSGGTGIPTKYFVEVKKKPSGSPLDHKGTTIDSCFFSRRHYGTQAAVAPRAIKIGEVGRAVAILNPFIICDTTQNRVITGVSNSSGGELTGSGKFTNVGVGDAVFGNANIVAGTTVVAKASSDSITVSPAPSSTFSNQSVTFLFPEQPIVIESDVDAVVVGGSLEQPDTSGLIVGDQGRTALLGAMRRIRFPRLTATERDALVQLLAGDTIWNTTAGQMQVWDGTAWKKVDLVSP